jgi:membrane protease YdiL (CAAX protease family)
MGGRDLMADGTAPALRAGSLGRPGRAGAPARMAGWARRRPLAAYVAMAYGFSWLIWIPGLAAGGAAGALALSVGAFGPAVAAALVIRWTGGSLRAWLARIVRWRVPARYYAYALGLPALLFGAMNLLLLGLGEDVDPGRLGDALLAYPATLVLVALVGGGQEEPGWRGYALDELQARHSPLAATALLGVIWGAWHLPLYGLGFVGPMMFVVFYTWLYNRTRSVLLCILLHASFTPALDHLLLVEDSMTVDLVIVGTLLAAAAALVTLTRGRLGFDHRPAG